ncbi:hypothetical protein QFZ94_007355 [Paraburkholderia sp. JPY465]
MSLQTGFVRFGGTGSGDKDNWQFAVQPPQHEVQQRRR